MSENGRKNKRIGYARISDRSQEIRSQIDQLEAYGVDEIIQETISSISWEKKLYKEIDKMIAGDTIIVIRPDRIARNTTMLLTVAEKLEEKGIDLVILSLGIDTRTPAGKMVLTIMGAVAQWEKEELAIKQKNGVKAALKRGVRFGPKPKNYNEDKLKHAIELYRSGEFTVDQITKNTGVPRATLYRRLKREKLD